MTKKSKKLKYKCYSCCFVYTNSTGLGKHYRKHPSHATKRWLRGHPEFQARSFETPEKPTTNSMMKVTFQDKVIFAQKLGDILTSEVASTLRAKDFVARCIPLMLAGVYTYVSERQRWYIDLLHSKALVRLGEERCSE